MDEIEAFLFQEKERLLKEYRCNTIQEVIQKLEAILGKPV
jgi:hypothetical protein